MAVFTDGSVARLEDLHAYESAVLDLASTERIDVASKLRLAQRELATDLIPFLTKNGIATRDLSNVVVTDALVEAHALRTLALLYRDLYQSQLNDRYEGKWREYVRQSENAMLRLFDAGVGICHTPLPKAPLPTVWSISEGVLPARTYYVRIAWANAARVTGALSDPVFISLVPGSRLRVSAPAIPPGVTGWVIYAGTTPVDSRLQTNEAIPGDMHWTETADGLRANLTSWPVQTAELFVENRRTILRG